MRKRVYLIYGLYIAVISALLAMNVFADTKKLSHPEIYFVDSDMFRLVSVDFECDADSKQKQAEAVISELILGRDRNKKIKRMIPNIIDCLSVKVKDDTAYVDIKEESIDDFADGRVCEALTVYQIVNSLTSIDGVIKVKFTIGGKVQKEFKGFIDMRETFIPDYYV